MTTATLPREIAALRPDHPPARALTVAGNPRCRRYPAPEPRYVERPPGRRTPVRWDAVVAGRIADPAPALAYCLWVVAVDLTLCAVRAVWAWERRHHERIVSEVVFVWQTVLPLVGAVLLGVYGWRSR